MRHCRNTEQNQYNFIFAVYYFYSSHHDVISFQLKLCYNFYLYYFLHCRLLSLLVRRGEGVIIHLHFCKLQSDQVQVWCSMGDPESHVLGITFIFAPWSINNKVFSSGFKPPYFLLYFSSWVCYSQNCSEILTPTWIFFKTVVNEN